MRLPLISYERWQDIKVYRYGAIGGVKTGLSTEIACSVERTARGRGVSRRCRLLIALGALDLPGSPVPSKGRISLLLPYRVSRRTKARGWKRLVVEQPGLEPKLSAWFISVSTLRSLRASRYENSSYISLGRRAESHAF